MIIKGQEAIALAEVTGINLSKYADPIEDERDEISLDEAREIAEVDANLIYIDVETDTFGTSLYRNAHDALVGALHTIAYGDSVPTERENDLEQLRENALDAARQWGSWHAWEIARLDDDELAALLDDVHAADEAAQ